MKRILYTAIVKHSSLPPKLRLVVFCNKYNTLSYKLFNAHTGYVLETKLSLSKNVLPIHFNEFFSTEGTKIKTIFDNLFSENFEIIESSRF
jgi:hypothetical protein